MQKMPKISLTEINEQAQLLTRVDRKYVLPIEVVSKLLIAMGESAQVLQIESNIAHLYKSTYFDTPELVSYHSAAFGRRRRFKVRARTYVDTGLSFIEVKTKGANKQTVKERVAYAPKESTLSLQAVKYVDSILRASNIDSVNAAELQPVLTTEYKRTTLLLPLEGARATVDFNLRIEAAGEKALEFTDLAVVETKSGSTPSSVDRLIWTMGYRESKISKFGTGMAALYPDLPSNKWHRVLTKDLKIKESIK